MLGIDLRDNEDIVNDLIRVGDIAKEYRELKDKFNMLLLLSNIERMDLCDCRNFNSDMSFQDRLKCTKCGGIGYIIKYKEKKDEVSN